MKGEGTEKERKRKWKGARLIFFHFEGIACFFAVLMAIFLPYYYMTFRYWEFIPNAIKIGGGVCFPFLLFFLYILLFNGIFITKKKNLYYFFDFRIRRIPKDKIKKMTIVFTETDYKRYYATILISTTDGKNYKKNYSRFYAKLVSKALWIILFSVGRKRLERIVSRMRECSYCEIEIHYKNGNEVRKKKAHKQDLDDRKG